MKLRVRWKALTLFLMISALGTLAACAPAGDQDTDVTTLIYANLTKNNVDLAAVDRFNSTHKDVQIEVRDYLDEDGISGQDRLMAEMAAGKIPDIIDLGRGYSSLSLLPYQVLARKGYLEDLWPYIENDPDLGREGVLEAPLKAAEVDGGLYVLFDEVWINTLAGAESVVGDRMSWTLAELQEAFAAMPEESTILPYNFDKLDTFVYMMCMTLDGYVDWENGQCSFDCENFREALQFVNGFPDEFQHTTAEELNRESLDRLRRGKQMLWAYPIYGVMDVQMISALIADGGRVSFVGYPTTDGSVGSSFYPIRKLAMSSACQDKEAAWEFLRQMILPKYDREQISEGEGPRYIPINREDFDNVKRVAQSRGFFPKEKGFGQEPDRVRVECHRVTDEEWEQYEALINSITKVDMYDTNIYNIVWEPAGAYFAGDKTLDETVALIQNRVTLYVNEQR